MSSTDDLIAFFAARLDEKEAAAKAAASVAGPGWKAETYWPEDASRTRTCVRSDTGAFLADVDDTPDYPDLAAHIALNDPGHALREVAADRAILAKLEQDVVDGRERDHDATEALEQVVRIRAAVWSGHSNYRQEWKP